MEISRADERPEVSMLLADKDRINRFSRLLSVRNDARATLARREKLQQLHADALDELMLLDDDAPAQYNVGDAFFFDDKAEIEARVEKMRENLESEVEELRSKIEETSTEITLLKATLYAKFGKTINLEESSED